MRVSRTLTLPVSKSLKIAEHLEEHEELAEEAGGASRPADDETALTDLDEFVDAAVASVQSEQESDANRAR